MTFKHPSETDIITYRIKHQCSLMKARNHLMKAAARRAVRDCQNVEDLKELILFMFDMAEKDDF